MLYSRRVLLRSLACATAAVVSGSCADTRTAAPKIARVGFLAGSHDPATEPLIDAFREGLRELGYTEGGNLQFELRWGEGDRRKFDQYAAELVRMPVDVLVTSNADALAAMRRATTTIPIVLASSADPVEAGWVQSLSRPGGNITGMANQSGALASKSLELLKEAFPAISRAALLADGSQHRLPAVAAVEETARTLGIESLRLEVGAASPSSALARSLDLATARAVDSLVVLPAEIHVIMLRKEIVAYTAARRIPAMYPALGGYADAGGLMAYGANVFATFRRSATYVDRILKGANPAELPIEQSTKFDLVTNLKTAKELGLTIAPSIVSRATRVIQ